MTAIKIDGLHGAVYVTSTDDRQILIHMHQSSILDPTVLNVEQAARLSRAIDMAIRGQAGNWIGEDSEGHAPRSS